MHFVYGTIVCILVRIGYSPLEIYYSSTTKVTVPGGKKFLACLFTVINDVALHPVHFDPCQTKVQPKAKVDIM